ncbi:hypothetical protein SO802_026708 [Lithocarpus litseifolius]|uniref:PB1-like domain-containing protein n=1 Tax=Lithocarpus litseifolius TaxID=425828 RepID=A0AAW2C1Y6_9ROSI
MQTYMDDEEVKLEVHYGGAFLWNPSLEYFDGKVEIVYRDLDRLSYFELQGICEELGIDELYRVHYLGPGGNLEQDLRLIQDDQDAVPMCKPNDGGPRDTIILYTVRGAPWFSSSQPTPHTSAETWDSRPPATRGAALKGRGDAARTQKCRTRGGKVRYGGRGRGRGSK